MLVFLTSTLHMASTETLANPFPPPVQIIPVTGLPEIAAGYNLGRLITDALKAQQIHPQKGDILVVAQKIISKAEGKSIHLNTVHPSERAEKWAAEYQRDPRLIEIVLREASRIVRMERGVIIAETQHGFVCANAGVDLSNALPGTALLLPDDPDHSARALQEELRQAFNVHMGVIISDTFGRPWREGLVNVALGVAGMPALADYRGRRDTHGKMLQATIIAVADELAAAAGLVMGKLNRVPVVVIRGVGPFDANGTARDLIRSSDKDLFR